MRGDCQHIELVNFPTGISNSPPLPAAPFARLSPLLSIGFMRSERVFMGPCARAAARAVSVTEEELSDKMRCGNQSALELRPGVWG